MFENIYQDTYQYVKFQAYQRNTFFFASMLPDLYSQAPSHLHRGSLTPASKSAYDTSPNPYPHPNHVHSPQLQCPTPIQPHTPLP